MVHEEFKVVGKELVDQVGQLIHAGNVRRIIVKDDKGNTFSIPKGTRQFPVIFTIKVPQDQPLGQCFLHVAGPGAA